MDIHGPLQTRGETRCPGGVSVSCLASRTRHECPRDNKVYIYGGLTLDVDRHYIGSVTATTHQEKGIITLESNPSRGTVLPAPHGKGNKCDKNLTLDVDRHYIGSVTATTHQEKGIITLESNPSRGTVLPAPHGKGNKCDKKGLDMHFCVSKHDINLAEILILLSTFLSITIASGSSYEGHSETNAIRRFSWNFVTHDIKN